MSICHKEQTKTDDSTKVLYIVVPPDGGWGWVIVTAAFFAFLISDGLIYSYGIFLSGMSETFNCPKSNVVLTGAIMTSFFCLTSPFTSALVNKFGYRKTTICGSFLASASCFLTAMCSTLYLTYLTYGILGGIGFGMIYLPSVIAVGFYFERWRALATAIAVCGAGIGGIVLPVLLTILLDEIGWRNTFKVMSFLSSLCILCGFLYRPLKPVCLEANNYKNNDSKRQGFFNQYHNTNHPTILDVHSKSRLVNANSSTFVNSDLLIDVAPAESIEIIFKMTEHESRASYNSSTRSSKLYLNKSKGSRLSTLYEEEYNNKCFCFKYGNIKSRPLYRDDIFYKASVYHLPAYQTLKSENPIKYTMQVTRDITERELNEKRHFLCSESIKRTLATMLDVRLLKSPSFLLFIISGILTSLGFYTPYMFIKDRSIQNGLSNETAFWLISCVGITNTLGRILCGIISCFSNNNSIMMSCISLFVGGLTTILSGCSYNLWAQFGYAAVYGCSVACISASRTIIIVEILGLENLTNAIGIFLMFQGIASLIGTTISGLLREITGEYNYSFYFAGVCLLMASLFMFPIKRVSAWEKHRSVK